MFAREHGSGLGLQNTHKITRRNPRGILFAFFRCELAFRVTICQFVQPELVDFGDLQVHKRASHLNIELRP